MKKMIVTLTLTIIARTAGAVPAKPGQLRTITLADGTTVQVRLVGDEHGHY